MTLEVLFAQASQGRTFLLMVLCGAAMAMGVQLAGALVLLLRVARHYPRPVYILARLPAI